MLDGPAQEPLQVAAGGVLLTGGLPAAWLTWRWAGVPKAQVAQVAPKLHPSTIPTAAGPAGWSRCDAPVPSQPRHGAACACPHVGARARPGPALPPPPEMHLRLGQLPPGPPGPVAAGQLVTILECLALSYRICTPAPGGPGPHFQVRGCIQTGGKFPFPHQDFNCEVAWM